MAKKTKHYILKKGMRMSYIQNGEPVNFVGDGKGTVELNEDQAAAFKDKFSGESDEPVEFENPTLAGGQTLEGTDINQAAEEGMASNDEDADAKATEGTDKKAGGDDAKPAGGAAKK